jgi:hypothetical protein
MVDGYVAAFVPFVRTGNLVYLSGRLAKKMASFGTGKVEKQITTLDGKQAACGIAIEFARHAASRPRGPGQNKADR